MKRLNELNNIEFEGYVWLSDQEEPIILNNQTFDFSKYEEGSNPFIIEALLFDKTKNKSIHITHTGRYHINDEFDLDNLKEGSELEPVEYLPHRLDGVDKVCFKQLWIPEKDEYCDNLPVLKMKALIFTGFKYKTEK
jgi:CRISPR type III-associated protein (TIGR04423 family)